MMNLTEMDLSWPDHFIWWAKSLEHLADTMPTLKGTHTEADLFAGVVQGQFQWWSSLEATALTEIVIYPRIKAAHVFMIGGKLEIIEAWLERGGQFDSWAFGEMECDRQTYVGRKGLKRVIENIEHVGEICMRGRP